MRYLSIALAALIFLAVLALPAPAAIAQDFIHDPSRDAVGRTYVYTRSNLDGSRAETISVHRAATDRVEVTKWTARCTGAAFVWAELDTATLSTPSITGGRLLPDAEHMEFAFVTHDAAADRIDVEVRLPDQTISGEIALSGAYWTLYDFDFASLTVALPHLSDPEAGFAIELPLLWADPSGGDLFRNLGVAEADFAGPDTVNGAAAYRYEVSGGAAGAIWLDAQEGHILRAELDQPNHPGYADFRLELEEIADEGEAGWDARLRGQYEGCEG